MQIESKILGFDMDGVIIDNNPLKLAILLRWGYSLKIKDMGAEVLKKILSDKDFKALQMALYRNLGQSLSAELMPGSELLLNRIQEAQIPFYLISRRGAPEIAIELLKARGLWPKYFNESNAFFVVEPIEKNITAKKLGVTHYVDDETRILSVLEDVPNKFLFDHLNSFQESNNYIKVASHEELAKYFLE